MSIKNVGIISPIIVKKKGDFYEIYAITRVGNNGKEKSLGKLQIAII